MSTDVLTPELDAVDAPALADAPLGPDRPPAAEPVLPVPPAGGDDLRPAVRAMVAELAEHFKGADPGSIDKAAAAVRPGSANPKSWESRGQAAAAVKAYRASLAVQPAPAPPRKRPVRTTDPKPARTTVRPSTPDVVQPAPVPPAPVVVRPDPPDVVRTAPESVDVPLGPPPADPGPMPAVRTTRLRSWPVLLIALPAAVAIWSGWVGLGGLTGFGVVHPLPGIWDSLNLNTAITLPIGVEAYAAYALRTWLTGQAPDRARRFAKWSAIGSLIVGAAGQVAYHVLVAYGVTAAPWWITTIVACLPVAVLGMAAALAHLINAHEEN